MIYEQDLKNLCLSVARKLVEMPNEKDGLKESIIPESQLIFPQYEHKKEKKERISEQESRILFCNEIENYHKEIYYSIETPTDDKYSFGDTLEKIKVDPKGQSALFDMSLFEIDETNNFKQMINIELKSHNVNITHIAKDFLKLLNEWPSGVVALNLNLYC